MKYWIVSLLSLTCWVGCSRVERPADLQESVFHDLIESPLVLEGQAKPSEVLLPIPLEGRDDFRLEARLDLAGLQPKDRVGLIFGKGDELRYVYEIIGSGVYSLSIWRGDKALRLIRPRPLPVEPEASPLVTLAVERVGDSLFLYRNDVMVDRLRHAYTPGSSAGITFSGAGRVRLERFGYVNLLDPRLLKLEQTFE